MPPDAERGPRTGPRPDEALTTHQRRDQFTTRQQRWADEPFEDHCLAIERDAWRRRRALPDDVRGDRLVRRLGRRRAWLLWVDLGRELGEEVAC